MKRLLALTLALLLMLGASAAFADELMDFTYATYVGGFSDEGLAVFHARNGLYGYVNTKGKVEIPASFSYAGDFADGLALVKVNMLYGYINTAGEVVIDCKWDDANSFSEGVAVVKKGDYYGLIDTTGAVVLDTVYKSVSSCKDGYILVMDKEYKEFYVDKTGAKVNRTFESEAVFTIKSETTGSYTKTYHYELRANGHAIAKTSLYDYDSTAGFSVDAIHKVKNTESLWVITKRVKNALDKWPTSTYILYDSAADKILMQDMKFIDTTMSAGMIAVKDDSVGYFVNDKGVMQIRPVGADVWTFTDGVARVRTSDGVYAFINTSGNKIASYDDAHDMNNGFATVRDGSKWHVIDSQGNWIN